MTELPPEEPVPHEPPPGPTSHRAQAEAVPLGRRLLAPLAAVAVVVVVIVLLILINGHNPKNPTNAGATPPASSPTQSSVDGSAGSASTSPTPKPKPKPKKSHHTTSPSPTAKPKPKHHPSQVAAPPNTAMADVTVLNNSRISGLAHRVAAEVGAKGWRIAQVGNLPGLVPATTVYYAPGNEAAAAHLASEFSQIQRIEPDSEGRLHTPGITLVTTRYWTG